MRREPPALSLRLFALDNLYPPINWARQMLSAGSAAGLASSAAKSHPEDPKVVAASMRVISAISVNGDNQLRAAQDGALEVVVEALKGVECEEVAYESCVALSRLVESHMGNKCVVADLGGEGNIQAQ